MLTLAFAQIVWAICFKWNEVTGGEQGMPEIPYPDFDWLERLGRVGAVRSAAIGTSEYFYFRHPGRRRRLLLGPAAHRRARRSGAC